MYLEQLKGPPQFQHFDAGRSKFLKTLQVNTLSSSLISFRLMFPKLFDCLNTDWYRLFDYLLALGATLLEVSAQPEELSGQNPCTWCADHWNKEDFLHWSWIVFNGHRDAWESWKQIGKLAERNLQEKLFICWISCSANCLQQIRSSIISYTNQNISISFWEPFPLLEFVA